MQKQVTVWVNALVDEGIAPLVEALADVPGVMIIESSQGSDDNSASVVFYMEDWLACDNLLFERLIPLMPIDLRPNVFFRVEACAGDTRRVWINLDLSSVEPMSLCVRQLAQTYLPPSR